METLKRKLKRNEKIILEGLSILTDGSIEILIDNKPVESKKVGEKIGYDLIFNNSHKIELRALEDDTTLMVVPFTELKRLYKNNYEIKKIADKRMMEIINEFYGLITSTDHFTFEQVIEKLTTSGNGNYCILNISQLCKEWGYSRQQFYRVVENLEKKGIFYDKSSKCFRKK